MNGWEMMNPIPLVVEPKMQNVPKFQGVSGQKQVITEEQRVEKKKAIEPNHQLRLAAEKPRSDWYKAKLQREMEVTRNICDWFMMLALNALAVEKLTEIKNDSVNCVFSRDAEKKFEDYTFSYCKIDVMAN